MPPSTDSLERPVGKIEPEHHDDPFLGGRIAGAATGVEAVRIEILKTRPCRQSVMMMPLSPINRWPLSPMTSLSWSCSGRGGCKPPSHHTSFTAGIAPHAGRHLLLAGTQPGHCLNGRCGGALQKPPARITASAGDRTGWDNSSTADRLNSVERDGERRPAASHLLTFSLSHLPDRSQSLLTSAATIVGTHLRSGGDECGCGRRR